MAKKSSVVNAAAMAAGPEVAIAAKLAPIAQKMIWGFFGLIAVAVGLFFSYRYSPNIFYGIVMGGVVGLLWGMMTKLGEKEKRLSAVISKMGLFIVIGVVVALFWAPITLYASEKVIPSLSSILSNVKQTASQVSSKDYWDAMTSISQAPTTQTERATVDVKFTGEGDTTYFTPGSSLDVIATISVYTPDMNIRLLPTCSLDRTPIKVEITKDLSFIKSSSAQSTTLHCKGESHEGELKLELQRSVSIKATLPVTIAPKFTKDLGTTSVKTEAPFSLTLDEKTNQPLLPGTYDISIYLSKKEKDAELISLDALTLTTQSESISLQCDKFSNVPKGIKISNLNAAALKNYDQSATGTLYVFNCKLTVSNVNEEAPSHITAEALYNIKTSHVQKIRSRAVA